tara:strand:+ start:999 stop:2069 length:1071 start_codon:yes stop_codon:yes gene_type:complete
MHQARKSSDVTVSVVIPARNEGLHIRECLDSFLNGDYSSELIEIIVVDGLSTDNTMDILKEYQETGVNLKVISNPHKVVPHAMNKGIKEAANEVIIRADAHSIYPSSYVKDMVYWLVKLTEKYKCDICLGPIWDTVSGSRTDEAAAVACILSHPFGVGNSEHKIGRVEGVVEVDAIPFGCYWKSVFQKVGYFDEHLIRNQDDEFHTRIKQSGGRIFLATAVRVKYKAREKMKSMANMLYQYGLYKPLTVKKLGRPSTLRQLVPPSFALLIFTTPATYFVPFPLALLWLMPIALYILLNIVSSISAAKGKMGRLPYISFGFFMGHMAYGIGYFCGIIKFVIFNDHMKASNVDLRITR